MSVALIVSLLGLAGLTLVRIERRQAEAATDLLVGRRHARSAVELGLAAINADANWRTNSSQGVETASRSLGAGATGTISWILEDSDGSLTNTDVDLRLKGIGRVGNVTQVSSVAIASTGAPSAERMWLDEYRPGSAAQFSLQSGAAIGTNFLPTLPAGTVRWKITRVAVWCVTGNSGTVEARIATRDAAGKPRDLIDRVVMSTNSLPSSPGWHQITFPDAIGLAPDEGACVVFQYGSGSGTIAQITRGTNSLGSPSSAVLTSANEGGTWTLESEQDLWIKVYGTYSTSQAVAARTGTWTWEAAP